LNKNKRDQILRFLRSEGFLAEKKEIKEKEEER